jgi:MFS family permease
METLDEPKTSTGRKGTTFFLNRHFALFWMSQTVSKFGSWITSSGLALTAVLVLHATAFQMGVLAALGAIPALLFGLLAGVWVDRLSRRSVLIITDLGRALLLLAIPLAALLGVLRLELMYGVALLAETLTVFFEVAHRSFLPTLIDREDIAEGNSKLEASSSLAEIAGPSLAGVLVQTISAPFAILFDALSFLFSALCIGMIRVRESSALPIGEQQKVWQEIWEGLQVIWHDHRLRALAVCIAMRNFFGGAFAALYTLYVVRDLGMTPVIYGILVTMGGVGALLGALTAARMTRSFGLGKILVGGLLIDGCTTLLTPLASGPWPLALALLIGSQLFGDCGAVLHAINEVSLRQMIVPDRFLGRVNASMHLLVVVLGPVGAVLAGLLSTCIGIRPTLFVGAGGILCSFVWLLFSPVRTLE